MKASLITLVWISLIGFCVMNLNYLFIAGIILGITGRIYSGSIISLVLGLSIGIFSAELLKFISLRC